MRLSEDIKPVDELLTSGAKLVRSVAENRRTILLTRISSSLRYERRA